MAVNADGTYSVDNVDLSTLVDGDITVVATATDSNGTTCLPTTLKTLMLLMLANSRLSDDASNKVTSLVHQDIPAGGTVTLVITDIAGTAITITDVAVNADGTYSVDNVDLSTLVDGDITVVATATDSNGNDLSANDTENLDAVDAQLTVDLVIDGDNNGDITGTSQDIPAGGTVTLVITDIAGTAITIQMWLLMQMALTLLIMLTYLHLWMATSQWWQLRLIATVTIYRPMTLKTSMLLMLS
ncbi:hypothetical protein [Shewanella japonica]|uniref:hypothetical protein n=1 Tax=Shewanella japonica TaxID=93973 RepID=UPI0009BC43B4|nr:hypothetical protein [Shewanella japonica]